MPASTTSLRPRRCAPKSSSRAAFTLAEMLTVIVIIAILLSAAGASYRRALQLSRLSRAETELRELVAAWLQYHQLYNDWPAASKGRINVDVTGSLLAPLIDQSRNDRGILFLNLTLDAGQEYRDPWGKAYQLSFDKDTYTDKNKTVTALRTSVSFPNRYRRFD